MQWRPKEARSKAQHKRSKAERPPVQTRGNQPARSEPPGKPHGTKASADKDLAEPRRKQPKYSRLHKPEGMSLEDWQIELRRQFGREQNFELENRGEHPIFSEFEVTNPQSQSTYTRPYPRPARRRQLLFLSRLRHQHARHLQAHRVHSGRAGTQARRRCQAAGRLPAAVQRGLPSVRRPAARSASGPAAPAPSSWPGWPAGISTPMAACCPMPSAVSRRSSARPAPSIRSCAAATTCSRSSPRCATANSAASASPRRFRAASAAPLSRICSRSRSTTISARASCSPPAPAAA